MMKKQLFKYGIATLAGGTLAYLTAVLHGYAEATTLVERYRILADAFTIPGVVIFLMGVLVWIAGEGAFQGLAYSLSWAFRSLIPFGRSGKQEKYYDYVERQKQKGKPSGYAFLFVVGGAFLAVAIVFIILFYQVY